MDCGEMGLTRRLRSEPYGSLEPTLIGLMTIKMAGRGLCFLAALVVGANSAGASCTDSDGSCTEWVAMGHQLLSVGASNSWTQRLQFGGFAGCTRGARNQCECGRLLLSHCPRCG